MALVGPYGSGKTSLLEAVLFSNGTILRKGSVAQNNTVGDAVPEARARQMSVEVNCATTNYLDQSFTFLDCPGSIEFLQDTIFTLHGIDAAVVVIEPEPSKVQMLRPYLKRLEDLQIPHILFVNKIEKASGSLRAILSTLQAASTTPLLLRQIPIWDNEQVTGFVDLALERAFAYRDGQHSEAIAINDVDREKQARYQMLERLADYDERLMEELLSDQEPAREEVFGDLRREFAEGLVVPVLIGSAERGQGITRLMKALRHECPDVNLAAARLSIPVSSDVYAQVLKTSYTNHGGKVSIARVMQGVLKDGAVLKTADGTEARVSGIFSLVGQTQTKLTEAGPGQTVALARLEGVPTGATLTSGKAAPPKKAIELLTPVFKLAVQAADRKDEVKLTAALAKLIEEDPSLKFEQDGELHEMTLSGQGEIHLRVATEKLISKYGLKLLTKPASVPYKETIRKSVSQRGRHKRQSGGHGQFGDVELVIRPQERGAGFLFVDQIVGGVVPRQWIPSVEKGVIEYLKEGPLGFPVVDISVTLCDGSYHTVDSSDAAFQTAARIGMQDGMPQCAPVLLEPIMKVKIHVPNESTSKINAVVSGRRGSLLGYDAREGWNNWDTVEAEMPQSEIGNLIVDLRSLTQGVATFEMEFDHLAELSGKIADQVVAARKAAKEEAKAG
ncbi:elongation factor G [Rhizomicrobium palustre]|uniref:Elongation factor G n=1 Tax=Rhizomicrobium palustre TaxID=189966 RepID=A0A846MVU3_9PROT|nr:elongation factor G [Rhizomicrobium palustre]